MENTQRLAFQLHDLLLKSKEFQRLKEKEKAMFLNETSKKLIEDYKASVSLYGTQNSEVNLKKMHEAKLAMDKDILIQEYKQAYKDYQILIGEITDIVFEDFSTPSIIDKIIRAK